MDISENLKGYTPYEQMNDLEKAKVDYIVEEYRRGLLNSDYSGITNNDVDNFINNRLDLEHLHQINEKINEKETAKNAEANLMRYQLFEERWKKGYYRDGKNMEPKEDSSEVKELKDEVKSLKNDIGDLKKLLIDKLS